MLRTLKSQFEKEGDHQEEVFCTLKLWRFQVIAIELEKSGGTSDRNQSLTVGDLPLVQLVYSFVVSM